MSIARELDFVKRTCVRILTSTTVPRVGNLTRPPYCKVEKTWGWVIGRVPSWKHLEGIWGSFPRLRMAEWRVPRQFMCIFSSAECVWNCSPTLNHAKYLQYSFFHLGKCTNFVGTKYQLVLNYSLEECCNLCVVSACHFVERTMQHLWSLGVGIWPKMETQGWENWHWKPENVKFSMGCPPPPNYPTPHPRTNRW